MSSLTLKQRRAIDRRKEDLVRGAETLLDDGGVVRLRSRDFGHSQLRNLIAVALDTESPAVVMNFIRYQMGRDKRGDNWRSGPKTLPLGSRFIAELEGEGGTVSKALGAIAAELPDALSRQLAQIEMIRLYLGFAARYLKYLDLQRRNGGGEGEA